MIFLGLSVICSVLLGFIFKLFPRFGVDSFQAIIFNYYTCLVCGWIQLGKFPVATDGLSAPWVPFALILGFIFISGFNFAAMTVRYFGVTISQIMQKMSILITVPFAILMYHETSGLAKIGGFLLALASIILVNWPSRKQEEQTEGNKKRWWIPFLTWALAGALELLFVVVKHENLVDTNNPSFITTIFFTAGTIGLAVATAGWITGRIRFSWRNVAGGIILGIPNYGSMLFLLMALGHGMEGSFVFPAINVSIIALTTILAVALFQEKLSALKWIGFFLALLSIVLISR
jgi:drug/metabolite transporter (DMT)-like permease